MKDHKKKKLCENNATPLSHTGCMLNEMLALYGAEEERANLIDGHTFGSAISEARKKLRLSLRDFLDSEKALTDLGEKVWNEVEQNRYDPANLDEDAMRAIASVLKLSMDDLRCLAAQHSRALAEDERLWGLLVLEAHAFRRRRDLA